MCESHRSDLSNVPDSLPQMAVNAAAGGSSERIDRSAVNSAELEDASTHIQALLEVINMFTTLLL
jgi:hypothetical protein